MWRRKGGGEGEGEGERDREGGEREGYREICYEVDTPPVLKLIITIHSPPLYNMEAEVFHSWGFPLGYHTEVFRSLGCLG